MSTVKRTLRGGLADGSTVEVSDATEAIWVDQGPGTPISRYVRSHLHGDMYFDKLLPPAVEGETRAAT